MNIKIITTKKINEKFSMEGIKEYQKRLSRYCKLKLVQLKNENGLEKEINEKTYLILVNAKGEVISSEQLADKLSNMALKGQSDVTFIVSEEELPSDIADKADFKLAVSRMDIGLNVLTLTLHEQIYRAFRINGGEPYHK
ncbi:ribosomal RNA large subunit methyltransferase H [Gottschalkia purinilytica]|uniref:Ribosomal RNA large subunit methyltransferase H n=1 Tax=Gottschalkia purinilytica TaxID=1503 RepID=A0A0L0W7S1_GOTPU|nr:23S rRNA (pseudouridine(1915)-N(3))-methyltransferase RlmH [Gottschalkia purinilytica]KNF07623.1 ribosomal RNA large subunit methyltransferase H [Gottschalkia purinilytica]